MLAPKAIWWLPRLTTNVPIACSADRLEMRAAGRAPGRSQAGPHPLGGSADVPVGRGADMNIAEQRSALVDSVARFAEREIAPHVTEWDRAGEFPRALYRQAAELGLLGLGYPEHL